MNDLKLSGISGTNAAVGMFLMFLLFLLLLLFLLRRHRCGGRCDSRYGCGSLGGT